MGEGSLPFSATFKIQVSGNLRIATVILFSVHARSIACFIDMHLFVEKLMPEHWQDGF
jgi:hypothetical protein